jgi:hypothetical protein
MQLSKHLPTSSRGTQPSSLPAAPALCLLKKLSPYKTATTQDHAKSEHKPLTINRLHSPAHYRRPTAAAASVPAMGAHTQQTGSDHGTQPSSLPAAPAQCRTAYGWLPTRAVHQAAALLLLLLPALPPEDAKYKMI